MEVAARYIKRYLQHDLKPIQLVFNHDIFKATNEMNSLDQLLVLKDQIVGLINHEFDKSVKEKKENTIKRLLCLFPQVGMYTLGLDKLSSFLCGTLAR